MINNVKKLKLAIIGLGYVGLPLALEFAKKRSLVGFDINKRRINELNSGIDKNLEIPKKELKKRNKLIFTCDKKKLRSANCYIVTVPTPVNKFKKPNLKPLLKATEIIGKILKRNDLVIYESTVYPGCIEERCVPVLEKCSKLNYNREFFCGYSPERVNPGDKKHKISNVKKITSGSTPGIARVVDRLYNEIINVGTHKAPSIKVAEAAKVIENTQRDLNIALINELSILFSKIKIDTDEVLDAAGTKWNFFKFKPGLVGGHCIGVDPYYLTYKAKSLGYTPKLILAGRKLNDNMGNYIVSKFIIKMKDKKIPIKNAKILIMGLTFKENCTDIRNSGIENVIRGLKKNLCNLDLYDPLANNDEIKKKYGISPILKISRNKYDGVIIGVGHDKFKKIGIDKIINFCKQKYLIFDLKNLFKSNKIDLKL